MARLRTLLAGAMIGAALLVAAPAADAQVTFSLPRPTGRADVGVTSVHLVDPARVDPWKPDRQREIMVSVWYPAKDVRHYPRAPWITSGLVPAIEAFASDPALGIPAGAVNWQAPTAGHMGAPADKRFGGRPVVLYSPGFGGPRAAGSVLVQDLASRGYVVVTIDHTYETAVEFPGGRVEWPVPIDPTPEVMKRALDARVGDTRFVLDQLPRINRDVLRGAADLSRIGMFGHSYGGFTSGETMFQDQRIKAGINMDGAMAYSARDPYLPGEVVKHGLNRPFMLLGSQIPLETGELVDHHHTNDFDQSWVDFWANQKGWKADILLPGAGHYSYSDLQSILPQLAKPLNIPLSTWEPLIGRIDPAKSITAQIDRVSGFFDRFV